MCCVDRNKPEQQEIARSRMRRLVAHDDLVVSAQVLNEVRSVVLRGKVEFDDDHDDLASYIAAISTVATVVPLTADLTCAGLRISERNRMSFYDALILAAALHGRCDTIYTEDIPGAKLPEGVRYVDPFSMA